MKMKKICSSRISLFIKKIRLFLFFLLFLIINLYKNTNICKAIIYSEKI